MTAATHVDIRCPFCHENLASVAIPNDEFNRVVTIAAAQSLVSKAAIIGPSRKRRIFVARSAAMAALRHVYGISYAEIGAMFGGRDHSTVMNAVAKCPPAELERLIAGLEPEAAA